MKKLLLACIALSLLLTLAPAASAQDDGYPACSESEILVLLSSLLDYVTADKSSVDSINELADRAGLHIKQRDSSFSLLPLCSAAIVTLRRVVALHGDALGGSALDRAGLSLSANPYFARDLVDETGIDRALADLMAAAGEGDAPDDHSPIRFCSRAENSLLNELAEEFQSIALGRATPNNAAVIVSIDLILAWREEKIALLPECAQAIELGFLLSKATTDAAALLAFGYAGVTEEDNPYTLPVAQARESLSTWRKDLKIIQPQYKGATVLALGPASALPPCHRALIRTTYRVLMRKVFAELETVANVETSADLVAYEQAHMELLESSLEPLPLCAEAFEFNWLARQILADSASWAAFKVLGFEATENPLGRPIIDSGTAMLSWIDKAEAILESDDRTVPQALEAPACRSGEILRVIGYLSPEFREFVSAGRAMEDVYALFDHALALREQLWQELPRCREALEIGLVMQQIAGDWIAMLTFDIAGADSENYVPYLDQVLRGVERFEELSERLSQGSPRAAKTYYVTANPYANIRSCAATSCGIVTTAQNGEALTVVDDSGDWYELRLGTGGRAISPAS